MVPLSPPARSTALDARLNAMLVLAAIVGPVAVPQRTAMAPPPHALDDFAGGLATGLAVSGYVGWPVPRD